MSENLGIAKSLDRGLILVNTGDGKGKSADVLHWLQHEKPRQLHVILTGRGAPPELIEAADLVTEMKLVKHHYQAGIGAVRGLEF